MPIKLLIIIRGAAEWISTIIMLQADMKRPHSARLNYLRAVILMYRDYIFYNIQLIFTNIWVLMIPVLLNYTMTILPKYLYGRGRACRKRFRRLRYCTGLANLKCKMSSCLFRKRI